MISLGRSVHMPTSPLTRRHLTPPTSSTNVERLFSVGGLTATDHRASLSGEKLDQILFLRENALMANFNLGWQQGVTTCGLSSLASFLKILSSKRVRCVFCDIRDKNAVNQGFWSITAVFSLLQQTCIVCCPHSSILSLYSLWNQQILKILKNW